MPQIQMVITYDSELSTVSVGGPLNNKVLAYGMLGAAQDAVREYKGEDRRIVPASFALPPSGK